MFFMSCTVLTLFFVKKLKVVQCFFVSELIDLFQLAIYTHTQLFILDKLIKLGMIRWQIESYKYGEFLTGFRLIFGKFRGRVC